MSSIEARVFYFSIYCVGLCGWLTLSLPFRVNPVSCTLHAVGFMCNAHANEYPAVPLSLRTAVNVTSINVMMASGALTSFNSDVKMALQTNRRGRTVNVLLPATELDRSYWRRPSPVLDCTADNWTERSSSAQLSWVQFSSVFRCALIRLSVCSLTRGQSNLTKSASRGGPFPGYGSPQGVESCTIEFLG